MAGDGGTAVRPAVRDPAVLVWAVAGLCWSAAVLVTLLGRSDLASHDEIIANSTLPWTARIAAFLLIWTAMIGAMMLPSTVPMIRLFFAVSGRAPHPERARATLFGTYLAIWVAFGLVALTGDRLIHLTVDGWPWLAEHSGLVKAGLLGLAGAVQFSALKDRCLTACRDPLSLLWQHYRRGAGAWRLGWYHALNCLGCCFGLMLVMFGIGVGNLAVMLGLTAVMVAEKTTRWGRRLVTPVGVVLLVTAAALALGALGIAPFAPALSTELD